MLGKNNDQWIKRKSKIPSYLLTRKNNENYITKLNIFSTFKRTVIFVHIPQQKERIR